MAEGKTPLEGILKIEIVERLVHCNNFESIPLRGNTPQSSRIVRLNAARGGCIKKY